ncbi:MAG: hypothetical protein ABIT01_18975 [Thermoanaerobaculia bacterium]
MQAALAVARMDLRRLLLTRRGLPLLILGAVPVIVAITIASLSPNTARLGRYIQEYAALFQILVLSGTLFFGVAATFVGLIRGEILDKSLHYLLLSPVRREAMGVGKYLAGFVATAFTFGLSTALSYVILLSGAGVAGRERLLSAEGLGALSSYVLAAVLACAAYGGLFLALGLLGKNPMVGAALVWIFERISIVFPPILRRLMPSYHLDSLLPVHFDQGPFALIIDPAAWWVSVPALVIFGALFATVASVGTRRIEVLGAQSA